jgi:hypothetical protein
VVLRRRLLKQCTHPAGENLVPAAKGGYSSMLSVDQAGVFTATYEFADAPAHALAIEGGSRIMAWVVSPPLCSAVAWKASQCCFEPASGCGVCVLMCCRVSVSASAVQHASKCLAMLMVIRFFSRLQREDGDANRLGLTIVEDGELGGPGLGEPMLSRFQSFSLEC